MFKRLERLALQPQRWGLTGEAEECLGLCVFCLIRCFFFFLVLIALKAAWKYGGWRLTAGGGEPVKGSASA